MAVLDVSVMAAIRSLGGPGEPDVYTEVARLFLADVPIHLSALSAAIAAKRTDSVGSIAHRLRGGALEMGALRMAPLCAAIEYTSPRRIARARGGAGRMPRSRVRGGACGARAGDSVTARRPCAGAACGRVRSARTGVRSHGARPESPAN